jgi:hypothetical protein
VIKLVIKLALVALIANAIWRVGSAYVSHYRFTDAVQATTQFRGGRTDDQIHDRLLDIASEYDIPLTDDTLTITRQSNHTIVDGAYRRPIEMLPGWSYGWPFKVHVDTLTLGSLK